MGADMLIAAAAAPHIPDEDTLRRNDPDLLRILEQIGQARIQHLPDKTIADVLTVCEISFAENMDVVDGFYDDPETPVDVPEGMIRAAREGLAGFSPFRNREVGSLRRGGRDYFVTGGMSWGDAPTDAFDYILLMDEVDLWEAPVTGEEVAAARTVLAATEK